MRVNPIRCVYFVGRIVSHGHKKINAIHINPFAIGLIIFEFVIAWMFSTILQRFINIKVIVRNSSPRFFDFGHEIDPHYAASWLAPLQPIMNPHLL